MKQLATLALVDVVDGIATFSVGFIGKKQAQRYFLWLSLNALYESGDLNPDVFSPVQWDGNGGHVTIALVPGMNEFVAYVSLFPDVWTPVSNEVSITL